MTKRYSSGTAWEASIGYSRAVRRGAWAGVSGTTAMDGTSIVGLGDAAAQATFVCEKLLASLREVGGELHDVVRVRMYITAVEHSDAVTSAFAKTFADQAPCATLVVVAGLIDPRLLVEMELDAFIV